MPGNPCSRVAERPPGCSAPQRPRMTGIRKRLDVRQSFRAFERGPRPPDPARRAVGRPMSTPRLQEVRRALIEADVALDVARAFTDEVKKRAVGVEVIKSVTPGQMVVKIVHDQLIETLGSSAQPIDLNAPAAGRHHDGRTARLGQNHHHRESRQAPCRDGQAQGADGFARHAPAGGDGATRRARPAGRHRYAADRRRTDAGADRNARAASRRGSAATTWCCSTPPAASRSTRR